MEMVSVVLFPGKHPKGGTPKMTLAGVGGAELSNVLLQESWAMDYSL